MTEKPHGYKNAETMRFLHDITEELDRARAKFPSSTLSLVALMKEVGELAKACLEWRFAEHDPRKFSFESMSDGKRKKKKRDIRREAVQVAAMAARIAIEGDKSITAPDDYKDQFEMWT